MQQRLEVRAEAAAHRGEGARLVLLVADEVLGGEEGLDHLVARRLQPAAVGERVVVRLEEGARSWQVEETRYHQGGGVEMSATIDLRTWLFPALGKLATATAPRDEQLAKEGHPTGIVVDARGLPFQPSLVPSITTGDDRPVVRAQLLAPALDARAAPVVYVTDPADPRAAARAGDAPLFAQAISAHGAELVLATGSSLADAPSVPALVAARRLVVVVDP